MTIKQLKVSVVIPVYNTEAYVEEAIKSIQKQSLQDFEIIVINDGSTDKSLEIISTLAASDPRIQIHSYQNNLGVSAARNKGLEFVNGEYIYFLDSDDLLESQALEVCYKKCINENLDFVYFDAKSINPQNKYHSQDYIHKTNDQEQTWKGIEILNCQLDSQTYRSPIWLNFIRTKYLQNHNLSFYPGIIHEDELFTFLLYINASKVGYISQIFSKRRLREDSIMTQKFSKKNIIGYFTVTEELLKYKKGQNVDIQTTIDKYLYSMLNAVIWNAHVLSFQTKWYILCQCFSHNYIKYIKFKNLLILFLKRNTY